MITESGAPVAKEKTVESDISNPALFETEADALGFDPKGEEWTDIESSPFSLYKAQLEKSWDGEKFVDDEGNYLCTRVNGDGYRTTVRLIPDGLEGNGDAIRTRFQVTDYVISKENKKAWNVVKEADTGCKLFFFANGSGERDDSECTYDMKTNSATVSGLDELSDVYSILHELGHSVESVSLSEDEIGKHSTAISITHFPTTIIYDGKIASIRDYSEKQGMTLEDAISLMNESERFAAIWSAQRIGEVAEELDFPESYIYLFEHEIEDSLKTYDYLLLPDSGASHLVRWLSPEIKRACYENFLEIERVQKMVDEAIVENGLQDEDEKRHGMIIFTDDQRTAAIASISGGVRMELIETNPDGSTNEYEIQMTVMGFKYFARTDSPEGGTQIDALFSEDSMEIDFQNLMFLEEEFQSGRLGKMLEKQKMLREAFVQLRENGGWVEDVSYVEEEETGGIGEAVSSRDTVLA